MAERRGPYASWIEAWTPERPLEAARTGRLPIDRFTPEQQAFLRRRVALEAPDLRTITREELTEHFGREDGTFILARIVMTFLVQYFIRFLDGQDAPIRGNIRSFWYRKLTGHLERLGLLDLPGGLSVNRKNPRKRYLLKTMENSFEALFKEEFFHYRDLDIYNHRERFRRIGRAHKRHLLYTEKEGLFWFCEEMHGEHSLHVYASRGSASWLDVDYLAQAIANLGTRKIYVAALTDYDPWGSFIARQIQTKLQTNFFGFRDVKLATLTDLGIFDPDIIHQVKRNLLKGHEDPSDPVHRIVMEWVEKGGGIDGEPYGIHVDHADWSRVRARLGKWLKGKWGLEAIQLTPPEEMRKTLGKRLRIAF